MLRGRLYIDGHDAYLTYGVYVVKDGWNELIAYPSLKKPEENEWFEEDGVEVDLSDPVLDVKEVQLKVAYGGIYNRFIDFVDMLSDGAYHEFECPSICRKFRLRLTQMPNLTEIAYLGNVTLKLSNDFPLNGYKYRAPQSSIMVKDDFTIDGRPFTDYGARILKGSLSDIKKAPQVKTALLRNIKTKTGVIYDGDAPVFFKAKDVKLKILMRAETLEELWRNYDALLYDLVRPGERSLGVSLFEQEFPCYYKSASVTKFYPVGKIWLEFTLTLTFTHDFRLNGDDIVLASEVGDIVFTQDDVNAIEMRPDRESWPSIRMVNDRMTIRLMSNGAMRFNN